MPPAVRIKLRAGFITDSIVEKVLSEMTQSIADELISDGTLKSPPAAMDATPNAAVPIAVADSSSSIRCAS